MTQGILKALLVLMEHHALSDGWPMCHYHPPAYPDCGCRPCVWHRRFKRLRKELNEIYSEMFPC